MSPPRPWATHARARACDTRNAALRHDVVLAVPVGLGASRASGFEIDRPALLTTRSTPPKASRRSVDGGPDAATHR